MTPEVSKTIEQAYRVFAPYTIGSDLIVCDCPLCMNEATKIELINTPLREISAVLLSQYTASGHGFSERVSQELRYFLPRYFELLAKGESPCETDIDYCLRRLGQAQWRNSWPAPEIETVERWFDAYAESVLAQHELVFGFRSPSTFTFESVLSLWIIGGADLDRLLRLWESADDLSAGLQIAAARIEGERTGHGNVVFEFPYLHGHPESVAKISAFLNSPAAWARITTALASTDDPRFRRVLEDGI